MSDREMLHRLQREIERMYDAPDVETVTSILEDVRRDLEAYLASVID